MKSFTDFHCHLLPAVDDGAVDLDESLEMARALAAFGFSRVHCTPHFISGGYQTLPSRVVQLTASLQAKLEQQGVELTLHPGTEHYLDDGLLPHLDSPVIVGATGRILVEVPFRCDAEHVRRLVDVLLQRRLKPLIAHPERCSVFTPPPRRIRSRFFGSRKDRDLSLFQELLSAGCGFQGNLGSFAGVYGPQVRERALEYLALGGYLCLGSDAHQPEGLPHLLQEGYRCITESVGEDAAKALLRGDLMEEEPF